MSLVYLVTRKLGACHNTLAIFTTQDKAVAFVTDLAMQAPDNSYLYWVYEYKTDFDYDKSPKGFPVGFATLSNGWVRKSK